MKDILDRLYDIARAYGLKNTNVIKRLFKTPESVFFHEFGNEDFDRIWEEFISSFDDQKKQTPNSGQDDTGQGNQRHYGSAEGKTGSHPDTPGHVIEDLAVFELTPPSSLEKVRKARNLEIKKYHSDRFMNDPKKLEISKEIMQIYNAAYDRLKEYYNRRNNQIDL